MGGMPVEIGLEKGMSHDMRRLLRKTGVREQGFSEGLQRSRRVTELVAFHLSNVPLRNVPGNEEPFSQSHEAKQGQA